MSSTNTNLVKKESEEIEIKNVKINKEKTIKTFLTLMNNIKQLCETLNDLKRSGYPNKLNLSMKIINSKVCLENDPTKDLAKIMEEYKEINKKYKKGIKKGYEECPLFRLFYGKQFIEIHKKTTNKNHNIFHLINSVTLNQIKNFEIDFGYNYDRDSIYNEKLYLEELFKKNNIKLEQI